MTGYFCYKVSVDKISSSLKWDNSRQTNVKATAELFQNIFLKSKPTMILKYFCIARFRPNAQISKKITLNPKTSRKTIINHAVEVYNKLPQHTRKMEKHDFKKNLKKSRSITSQDESSRSALKLF